ASLDTDVDPRAVAGRPDPMRQIANRDPSDLLEVVGAEREDFAPTAYGDVGKAATRVANDVDVIRDWTRVEHLEDLERRYPGKDHHLSDVLQGQPDLVALRCGGDVRAKGRLLFHLAHDLVIRDRDDVRLRREARAHVAVLAVRREDRHAGTVSQ